MDRRKMILAALDGVSIKVESRPVMDVLKAAILVWEKENGRKWDHRKMDHNARLMVNYIRHELSNYDRIIGKYGKETPSAVIKIRKKVYDAISSSYPMLAIECERQKLERFAA